MQPSATADRIMQSDCSAADTDDFLVNRSVAVEDARDVQNVTGVVFKVARLIGVDDRSLAVGRTQSYRQRLDRQDFACVQHRLICQTVCDVGKF